VGRSCRTFSDFRCVGFPRHRPIACFIVPNVAFCDAARDKIVLAFMPNPFPSVEEVAHYGEPRSRAGMQSYRTEGGQLAETWLSMQPLGSTWTDVAQEHWTSAPPIK
jgi:hypothetical protein